MVEERDITIIVEKVLNQILNVNNAAENSAVSAGNFVNGNNGEIPDITAVSLSDQFLVPEPLDREGYFAMKKYTPARLGVWRAGPRYKTLTSLRFRADHATAQDSVFSDVSDDFVKAQGFVLAQTACESKDQYLTRPDMGKLLSDKSRETLEKELRKGAKVQILVGDGLSSAAIEANIPDILPAIIQGLKKYSIEIGPIPFLKYCRVGAMDAVGELTQADVVCCLIGERPGLVTAESMSAYIAYKPTVNMPEARRTVVSNIHKGGTPPAEAGAHIAELLKLMLDKKMSGVDLKL